METVFAIASVGLLMLGTVWAARRIGRGKWPAYGSVGALLSGVVIAAVWRAADVPWVWTVPKAPLVAWLGAITLVEFGLVQALRTRAPGWKVTAGYGIGALVLNAGAFLALLWIATVSPGGV